MSRPPEDFTAHIGHYPTFGAYLAFYETAVRRLFEVLETGQEPPDLLAMPILALMRHSMQLGYKYSLWELHKMMGERFDTATFGHHRLAELHTALCDYFKRTVEHYQLPDSVADNFDEHRAKTEVSMQKFATLDMLSFSFRYPMEKRTGNPSFAPGTTVDLREMGRLYRDAMVLLRHTADVVGEYVELHKDLEREMWQCQDFGGW